MSATGLQLPTPFDSESRQVYATFVRHGRIVRIPRRPGKRILLLDLVAGLFEPGVKYPEAGVNEVLRAIFDDHAALRRYLVDNGFLDREQNVYWRSGGTVQV